VWVSCPFQCGLEVGAASNLVRLIQQPPKLYKRNGKDKLHFIKELPDAKVSAHEVKALLKEVGI
jgi:hypothetical protein